MEVALRWHGAAEGAHQPWHECKPKRGAAGGAARLVSQLSRAPCELSRAPCDALSHVAAAKIQQQRATHECAKRRLR